MGVGLYKPSIYGAFSGKKNSDNNNNNNNNNIWTMFIVLSS